MMDWDKWQEIFNSLRKQKLRTGLTAFGVFWGIFMLVILLGFGGGFGYKIESIFGDAKQVVLLWPSNSTQLEYQGFGKGRAIKFSEGDVDAIRQKIRSVDWSMAKITWAIGARRSTPSTNKKVVPLR